MIGEKYLAVGDFLRRQTAREIILSFGEIEKLIGAALPDSAYRHQEWWLAAVAHRSQESAWLEAGSTRQPASQRSSRSGGSSAGPFPGHVSSTLDATYVMQPHTPSRRRPYDASSEAASYEAS